MCKLRPLTESCRIYTICILNVGIEIGNVSIIRLTTLLLIGYRQQSLSSLYLYIPFCESYGLSFLPGDSLPFAHSSWSILLLCGCVYIEFRHKLNWWILNWITYRIMSHFEHSIWWIGAAAAAASATAVYIRCQFPYALSLYHVFISVDGFLVALMYFCSHF